MQSEKEVIDKYFFDKLPAIPYIRGIAQVSYSPIGDYGIMFGNPSKELLDNVRHYLGIQTPINIEAVIEHTPWQIGLEKATYLIRIDNAPKLNSSLGRRGLNVPKEQRKFPNDIPLDAIDHFSRGFLEALIQYVPKNLIEKYKTQKGSPRLPIDYNVPFLRRLYASWLEMGFIKGKREIKESPLLLSGQEVEQLYAHLYKDLRYLLESHMCVESSVKLLKGFFDPSAIKINQKILLIEQLLVQGVPPSKIHKRVDYASVNKLCEFYRQHRHTTMGKFLMKHKVNQAVRLMAQKEQQKEKVDLAEIAEAVGYLGGKGSGLWRAFKKVMNKTPVEFLKQQSSTNL